MSKLRRYGFLSGFGPLPSAAEHLQFDDILLTCLIFLGAAIDLTSGALNLSAPQWTLEAVNGMNATVVTDELLRATQVRGASGIESGVAAILIGLYRVARWSRAQSFNGVVFQITFCINTAGRSLQLALELPGFPAKRPAVFYLLVARLASVAFAFLLSTWTYRASWRWLWVSEK